MAGKLRYSMVACVMRSGWKTSASASTRGSGTVATPSRASMLPTRACSWRPVSIVNRAVLPTMGRPMIAVFIVRNRSERNLHSGEDLVEDLLSELPGALRESDPGIDHHTVSEHRDGKAFDVV